MTLFFDKVKSMKSIKFFLLAVLLIKLSPTYALSLENYDNCIQAVTDSQDSQNARNWKQLKIASSRLQTECIFMRTPQSLSEEVSYQFGLAEMMLGNYESSFQVANRCISAYYYSPLCHMLIVTYYFTVKDWSKFKESYENGIAVSNVVVKRLKADLKNLEKMKPRTESLKLRVVEVEQDLFHANSTIEYFNQVRNESKSK